MKTQLSNRHYVYVLLNPLRPGQFKYGKLSFNFEPFYVGAGSTHRIYVHTSPSQQRKSNKLKNSLIAQILKSNKKVIKVKVFENLSKEQSFNKEIFIIKAIGRNDLGLGSLLNLTNGGAGAIGNIHSEEHKRKISEKLKGVPKTKEHNKKVSEARKGIRVSESAKEKISNSLKKYFKENINKTCIPVKNTDTNETYPSSHHAARAIKKGNPSHILQVCKGIRNTHLGYKWSFA